MPIVFPIFVSRHTRIGDHVQVWQSRSTSHSFRHCFGCRENGNAFVRAEKVRLDYTRDVPGKLRCGMIFFVGMMARKLASLICVPLLKNNTAKVQELEQLYRASLPKPMEANASERHEKPYRDTWIAARGDV